MISLQKSLQNQPRIGSGERPACLRLARVALTALLILTGCGASDQTILLGRQASRTLVGSGEAISPTGVPPSPGNGGLDPSRLPVAAAQMPLSVAWRTLNVPSLPEGSSYRDPVTNVRVWKATSASVPQQNPGAGHDYSEGGAEISREWGGNRHTILVRVDFGGHWLVDFTRGVGFGNWRKPVVEPQSDLAWSFSLNPATPQIAYVFDGSRLQRINTATNQVENTGNFPKSMPPGGWLSMDRNDRWFSKMASSTSAIAWNSQTDQTLAFSDPGLNEIRLDPDGRWLNLAIYPNARFADLQNGGTLSAFFTAFGIVHNATLRGGLQVSSYVDASTPSPLRLIQAASVPSWIEILRPGIGYNYHGSGSYVQSDVDLGGDLSQQYAVFSTYNHGPSVPSFNGSPGIMDTRDLLQAAVGFVRADGRDTRLLCHVYTLYDNGDYWQMPRAKPSPDGKIVIFDSDMLNSGRVDLFVAEVPLR